MAEKNRAPRSDHVYPLGRNEGEFGTHGGIKRPQAPDAPRTAEPTSHGGSRVEPRPKGDLPKSK